VQDLSPALDTDRRVLRGDEDALVLVEALLPQLLRAGRQGGEEVRVQRRLSTRLGAARPPPSSGKCCAASAFPSGDLPCPHATSAPDDGGTPHADRDHPQDPVEAPRRRGP